MKRSLTILSFASAIILSLVIVFTSCKKKEIQGPKGEPGDAGVGGNANITTTNTFIINSASWTADTATASQTISLNFPELTQTVVDKGSVKVYKQTGTVWNELPFDTGDLLTQFGFEVGKLYLNYINIEGSPPPPPATARYRMVIISQAP